MLKKEFKIKQNYNKVYNHVKNEILKNKNVVFGNGDFLISEEMLHKEIIKQLKLAITNGILNPTTFELNKKHGFISFLKKCLTFIK